MPLTVLLLWVLAIGLIVMMISQGLTRKVDLFSIRNIYLAGFIVYQIASPALALKSDHFSGFRITNPAAAGKWMLMFNYIFIAIFLLSYHRIKISNWLAKKFPSGPKDASDSVLTGLAIAIVIAALGLRLIAFQVPLIAGVSINTSIAIMGAACAVIGWVWAARRLNPAVLIVVAFVVGVSLIIVLTGIYSRRPLISVLAGFAWGAYHRWAKHLSPSKLVISAAPLVVITAGVVAAFTAIRSHKTSETSAQSTLQQMKGASVARGTSDLLGGQAVGSAALWILDKYPSEIKYNPLFSFRYMAYWWVPRPLWEDKPEPLSTNVAHLAKLRGVNRDVLTIPPGIVGYAGAEGGFYAVVLYALFFGQFTRFFDDLIRLNPGNPYIILSVGCSTGQFLGLARGEVAIFTDLAIVGFVFSYLLIYVTALAFGQSGQSKQLARTPHG